MLMRDGLEINEGDRGIVRSMGSPLEGVTVRRVAFDELDITCADGYTGLRFTYRKNGKWVLKHWRQDQGAELMFLRRGGRIEASS